MKTLFVSTWYKYNSGHNLGEWVCLNKFASVEEFYGHCEELHKDETDPEFMFRDSENIPRELFRESEIHKTIKEEVWGES